MYHSPRYPQGSPMQFMNITYPNPFQNQKAGTIPIPTMNPQPHPQISAFPRNSLTTNENKIQTLQTLDGNKAQFTSAIRPFATPGKITQRLEYGSQIDNDERLRNIRSIKESVEPAVDKSQGNIKVLDVEGFAKLNAQLKEKVDKLSYENDQLNFRVSHEVKEKDEILGKLQRLEHKTAEWSRVENSLFEILGKVELVQTRYNSLLGKFRQSNEEFFGKSTGFYRKAIDYEELIFEKNQELLASLEAEEGNLEQGNCSFNGDGLNCEKESDLSENKSLKSVINLLVNVYNDNQELFNELPTFTTEFLKLLNMGEGKTSTNSLSRPSVNSRTLKTLEDQANRISQLLTELKSCNNTLDSNYQALARNNQENTFNNKYFIDLFSNVRSMLESNKIAQEIANDRLNAKNKEIQDLTIKNQAFEDTNQVLSAELNASKAKFIDFEQKIKQTHENQIAELKDNFENSIRDLIKMNDVNFQLLAANINRNCVNC
eukprot:TRINITY_DN1612_c0_g1_i5.p1 TRINITY_DN1612_c0_g1~~TRINITY_DN1612_c0_g1_i5.p1  ORF type:complete len:488 (+),score=104.34 TRINITY_DN1612_c0_g1_i5:161-1624(+)